MVITIFLLLVLVSVHVLVSARAAAFVKLFRTSYPQVPIEIPVESLRFARIYIQLETTYISNNVRDCQRDCLHVKATHAHTEKCKRHEARGRGRETLRTESAYIVGSLLSRYEPTVIERSATK